MFLENIVFVREQIVFFQPKLHANLKIMIYKAELLNWRDNETVHSSSAHLFWSCVLGLFWKQTGKCLMA